MSTEAIRGVATSNAELFRILNENLDTDGHIECEGTQLPLKSMTDDKVNELITEEKTREYLGESLDFLDSAERQQFVSKIVQEAKKVFATAVLTRLDGKVIYRIIDHFKITDSKLPVRLTEGEPLNEYLSKNDGWEFFVIQWYFDV